MSSQSTHKGVNILDKPARRFAILSSTVHFCLFGIFATAEKFVSVKSCQVGGQLRARLGRHFFRWDIFVD